VKHPKPTHLLLLFSLASHLSAQANSHGSGPVGNLRIHSRAALVDVLVTDHTGTPVTGLTREAFTVTEQVPLSA